MNCSPTITAEEFKAIHNAVCNLDSICYQLEDILKPELYLKLVTARNSIRDGLAGAYEQDHEAFSRKSRHFDDVKAQLELKNSEWSFYEVENLSDPHPYGDVDCVVYDQHWGKKDIKVKVTGSTWAALWVAADACIRDSGDEHHVFVEKFYPIEGTKNLRMVTGS